MVSNYSLRVLAKPCDVVFAISGLAAAMSKLHECSYLCGLWKEDLQIGFAWYIQRNDLRHPGDTTQPRLTPMYSQDPRIPTWSWVSQWGKLICFHDWERNATLEVSEGLSFISAQNLYSTDVLNPFARMNNIGLTVSGPVRRALVEMKSRGYIRSEDEENARWVALVKDPKTNEELGQIALDNDPAITPVDEIFCLLCTVREKYLKWQLTCLALVPMEEEREYHRVGLVFLRNEDWFGSLLLRDPNKFLMRVTIF
jgi:hypothetical protein